MVSDILFVLTPRAPSTTLFPYTTLFRSFASMAGQSISRLGIVEINSNTLRFKDSATGAVDTATYSVSGNLLTLDFQSVLQDFDIDDDGNPDPVRAYAVLRRN